MFIFILKENVESGIRLKGADDGTDASGEREAGLTLPALNGTSYQYQNMNLDPGFAVGG